MKLKNDCDLTTTNNMLRLAEHNFKPKIHCSFIKYMIICKKIKKKKNNNKL